MNLDEQNFFAKVDQIIPNFVKCGFFSFYFQMYFFAKVDQIKPNFVKCGFFSLYFQMYIVSKNLSMKMDRSKQRIFKILIFIDFLLVIILNVDLIKKIPY